MADQHSNHRPAAEGNPMVPDGFLPLDVSDLTDVHPALPEFDVSGRDRITLAYQLRAHLLRSSTLFDRGVPVRVLNTTDPPSIEPLTADTVAIEAQRLCRPVVKRTDRDGSSVRLATCVPPEVCRAYLSLSGEHGLRPIKGITGAPILNDDGVVLSGSGYCLETGLWRHQVPDLNLPESVDEAVAQAALARLRARFATFPFSDAEVIKDPDTSIAAVRQDLPPGHDEAAFLVALMTSVQRHSLPLAPGVVIRAPLQSGSGTGKGQLARAMAYIATGTSPHAFTAGHSPEEMDKRLSASLMSGDPFIFMDNANATALKSDTLASAITEPQTKIRILGRSTMTAIQGRACIVLTGNGLLLSEDLVSRFLLVELDAKVEDAETRTVPTGFLDGIQRDRISILEDLMLIARWGLTQAVHGKPLRNFTAWARRCRDPFLALGCPDPVDRLARLKAADPLRLHYAEVVRVWAEHHGSRTVAVADLHPEVAALIAPKGTRQMLATAVQQLVGMRIGGAVLTRVREPTRNTKALYRLQFSEA